MNFARNAKEYVFMEKGDLVQVSVLGGIETLRYLDQSGEVFFEFF